MDGWMDGERLDLLSCCTTLYLYSADCLGIPACSCPKCTHLLHSSGVGGESKRGCCLIGGLVSWVLLEYCGGHVWECVVVLVHQGTVEGVGLYLNMGPHCLVCVDTCWQSSSTSGTVVLDALWCSCRSGHTLSRCQHNLAEPAAVLL